MTSNRKAALDGLAFEARRNFRKSTEHWLAAAAAVVEARDLCEHGEWRPWLAKTGIPERTARRMVTIARAGLQIGHVAALGGVARTAEHIAETDDEAIAEHGAWGAIRLRMGGQLCARLILLEHGDGNTAQADKLLAAMPETPEAGERWIAWGEAMCDAFEADDRDRLYATHESGPWRGEAA